MDIHEIRRRNLETLIHRFGGQAELARRLDMEPNYISQLVRQHGNVGNKFARKIECGVGLERGWMDTLHKITGPANESTHGVREAAPVMSYDPGASLEGSGYVRIPGVIVSHREGQTVLRAHDDSAGMAVSTEWLRRRGLRQEDLRVIRSPDASMGRTIPEDSAVVIDTAQVGIVDGAIFLVAYAGEPRIKRIYKRPRGLMLHSDSDADFPPINLDPGEAEDLQVLGRVVHFSSDI